jgi:DNA-binding GntR family transcriptional regulator
LEGLCVRYMREAMTPAMPHRLSSILNEMRAAMKSEDQERFLDADLRLHRAIWRFSGRPQLERILETVMNSRGFLIAGTFSASIPFRTRMKDHDEYVKTVLRSPLSKVESEVERHFSDIYTQIFGGSSTQRLISSL